MRRAFVFLLAAGLFPFSMRAQNACDLTQNGIVDFSDVNLAVNMALGLAPCTANVQGSGICNVAVVQRVINAAMGGACVTGAPVNSHTVSLSWTGSISRNVAGYNIYRTPAAGGSLVKVNAALINATVYTDITAQSGQTYFYVATAVDTGGLESGFSSPPVQAVIPNP